MEEALTLEQLNKAFEAFETRFEEKLDKKLAKLATKEEVANLITRKEFKKVVGNLVTQKEFEEAIDGLITRKEFNEKIDRLDAKIEKEIGDLAAMSKVQFDENTNNFEEIKEKLKVLAPKFEVEELQKRTGKIELKLGITAATV